MESIIIIDDMAVADLEGPYPDAAYAILTENGIQVQHSTQQQDSEDGATDTTTANVGAGPNTTNLGRATGMVSRMARASAAAAEGTNAKVDNTATGVGRHPPGSRRSARRAAL